MPANTVDQRTLAQEQWGAMDVGVFAGFVTANFDQVAPTLNLTATAGAAAGTAPPAAVIRAGSNAFRGALTFGTGSATPAGGIAYTILFPFALALTTSIITGTPVASFFIWLQATTQATAAFGFAAIPTIVGTTVTGFTINTTGTLTASQGNTIFGLNWLCMG